MNSNKVCSNLCVGPLPRTKIYFFLFSIFVDEVISTPKIITFPLVPSLGCEKNLRLSNPIPYPELTAPTKLTPVKLQ